MGRDGKGSCMGITLLDDAQSTSMEPGLWNLAAVGWRSRSSLRGSEEVGVIRVHRGWW